MTVDGGDEYYSLQLLMSSCVDFATEITELQAKGKELGVEVITTSKYHAEIVGKGSNTHGVWPNIFTERLI